MGSKFLCKNKIDYLIVPAVPFVNCVFLWAGLEVMFGQQN